MSRDDEISIVLVEGFYFNGREFNEIHVSLKHINFDHRGHQRSRFTVEEVAQLFGDTLNGVYLEEDGVKGSFAYYVYFFALEKKTYKVVFSLENEKLHVRLITLYRTRAL